MIWRETFGEAELSSGRENDLGVTRCAGRALVLRTEPRTSAGIARLGPLGFGP